VCRALVLCVHVVCRALVLCEHVVCRALVCRALVLCEHVVCVALLKPVCVQHMRGSINEAIACVGILSVGYPYFMLPLVRN